MSGFDSVLVPLDGSRFAEAALPVASALAAAGRIPLRLVLVHADPPGAGMGGENVTVGTAVREREQEYLRATGERLTAGGTGKVEILHLEGDPGPVLAEQAARMPSSLVVMATHGRGALSRFWLGSIADYLIRHLSVPILLIRPSEEGESPIPVPVRFERVLVPLDGSSLSETVLDPAVALAELAGRTPALLLLTVVEPVLGVGEPGLPIAVPLDPELLQKQQDGAERRLEVVAGRLGQRGLTVETQVITGARPAPAILDAIAEGRADLVAMMTHGERGLRRALVGSVADKVVRGSPVPVLVIRPRARNGRES